MFTGSIEDIKAPCIELSIVKKLIKVFELLWITKVYKVSGIKAAVARIKTEQMILQGIKDCDFSCRIRQNGLVSDKRIKAIDILQNMMLSIMLGS